MCKESVSFIFHRFPLLGWRRCSPRKCRCPLLGMCSWTSRPPLEGGTSSKFWSARCRARRLKPIGFGRTSSRVLHSALFHHGALLPHHPRLEVLPRFQHPTHHPERPKTALDNLKITEVHQNILQAIEDCTAVRIPATCVGFPEHPETPRTFCAPHGGAAAVPASLHSRRGGVASRGRGPGPPRSERECLRARRGVGLSSGFSWTPR